MYTPDFAFLNLSHWALLFLLTGCVGSSPDGIVPRVDYAPQPIPVPILFAEGTISTPDNSEFDLAFSPDGRIVYFSRRAPEGKQMIYESTFHDNSWSTPRLAQFSNSRDETPFITSDGKYFFFGSERPIPGRPNQGNFDMNIWMMQATDTGWSTPAPLPAPINEVQVPGEQWPSSNNNFLFSNDNRTFYFTTMLRGTPAIKLYQTEFDGVAWSAPVVVEGFFEDEKYWVYSAVISPDGKYLVFNSFDAPGGAGGEDLFVSSKTANGWSRARPLSALVNTKDEESSPRFSRDGRYFFFSRAENLGDYAYGEWSIYFVETAYLNLEGGKGAP